MEKVRQMRYEIECNYFNRQLNESGIPVYFCNLYNQDDPKCAGCQFSKYSKDLDEV
ncbi:MAG: hypothetical protein ACXACR_13595 [Candidatus Hodarchaeales archaeon]